MGTLAIIIVNLLVLYCVSNRFQLAYSVFHGQEALEGEFPATVKILYSSADNKTTSILCTGSLITKNWVITAAHCTVDKHIKSPDQLLVIGGITDANKDKNKQIRYVKEIFRHPLYKHAENYSYDVALLEVWHDFEFDSDVQPVKLYDNDSIQQVSLIFSGWGVTSYTSRKSADVLQKYDVKAVDITVCEEYFVTDLNADPEEIHVLCGIGQVEGAGPCIADSGGGLYFRNGSQLVLYAILSGNDNCTSSSPAIFVRINKSMQKWIHNITKETEHPNLYKYDELDKNYFESLLSILKDIDTYHWVAYICIAVILLFILWCATCLKDPIISYLPTWLRGKRIQDAYERVTNTARKY